MCQKEKAIKSTQAHVSSAIADVVKDDDVSEVSSEVTGMVDVKLYVPEMGILSL